VFDRAVAVTVIALFQVACATTQPAVSSGGGGGAAEREFESYQLVLLKRGPAWTPEVTPEVEEIQKKHLAHLTAMGESGKMVIAGPFGDQPDPTLRGMCLYRVGSLEEARTLAEADPAVKAGRLKVEALTWYVEKGYMTFPKAPPATR
jgi:uncharacterized protein YciI